MTGVTDEAPITLSGKCSICADSRNPQGYWVGDRTSIRYCDGKTITLLAGGKEAAYQDGTAKQARFDGVLGMACTQNGDKLFVTDFGNNRIRMVDTKTGEVKTIAGNGRFESTDGIGLDAGIHFPRKVVFYRSPTAKPDSVLYFTSSGSVRRFDIESGLVSTLKLENSACANLRIPWGIGCTPSGHLIMSFTLSISLVDPSNGDVKQLAGSSDGFAHGARKNPQFDLPTDLVVVDRERCLYGSHREDNNLLCRITLPTQLFTVASRKQVVSTATNASLPPPPPVPILPLHIAPSADGDSTHHNSNGPTLLAGANPGSDVKSLSAVVAGGNPTSCYGSRTVGVTDSLRASTHADTNRQRDTPASVDAKTAMCDRVVAGDTTVEMKQIQRDMKSIWDEVIRFSDTWKVITSKSGQIGAIGPNAQHIECMHFLVSV